MENLSLEEHNIVKDTRNLFRVNKELNYTTIEDKRNIFRLEKEPKAIKDTILRDIKNLIEHKEEDENHSKSVGVINLWSNNYIKYESNGDKSKTLSLQEYLQIYLQNIFINNLKI